MLYFSFIDAPSSRTGTPSPYFADFSFPTPSYTTKQTNGLPSNGRRQWTPTTTTKIKTVDGSILADVDSKPIPSPTTQMPHSKSLFNHKQFQQVVTKRAIKSAGTPSEALPKSAWGDRVIELDASQIRSNATNDQLPFSKMKPENIDQSWMPNWFSNTGNNKPDEDEVQGKFRYKSKTECVISFALLFL